MIITVHVSKLNATVTFDSLPESSTAYLLQYGANQSINDAHASVQRKNFESDAAYLAAVTEKVDTRVEQIRSGQVPSLRGPAPITDKAAAAQLAKSLGLTADEVMTMIERAAAKKRPAA